MAEWEPDDQEWRERRAAALTVWEDAVREFEHAKLAMHSALRNSAERYGEYMNIVNERRTISPSGDPMERHTAKDKR